MNLEDGNKLLLSALLWGLRAHVLAGAGNPKGVVITHATLLACITGLQGYIREVGTEIRPGDVLLSYLTLAHIFGRAVEEFCLSVGAAIGYWQVGAAAACTHPRSSEPGRQKSTR